MTPSLPPLRVARWESTHMVLLIFQDGSIEGSLLPLLRGQSNLTAEPPEEEHKLQQGWPLGSGRPFQAYRHA